MRKDADGWTGSMKHPWINPPMKNQLGVTHGLWWETMSVLLIVAAAVMTVLVLVDRDVLGHGWAYAMIPIACVAAVLMGLFTLFKAVGEEKSHPNPDKEPRHP